MQHEEYSHSQTVPQLARYRLRLISRGDIVFQEMSDRIAKLAETLAKQQDAAQLQNAADVVKKLHEQLRELLDQ